MNRFLTRKKAKKSAREEPKPELDLAAALPPSTDFRTSLLMPNLSARFSMLREQDDPSSKLGKASDDSVLMSNRRSRLHDFGYTPHGLDDIAEVSSIHGSIKPFGGRRQDSFASVDGYGLDDDNLRSGGIMTRSRPGEGNNLFGGRQKVYKIPVNAGSSNSLAGSNRTGMGGRAVYENDIHTSAFQKYRQETREREEQDRSNQEVDSPAKSSSVTPSLLNYSNKRETASSTTSAQNARISTAATSINSQGANAIPGSPAMASPTSATFGAQLDRSNTKSRRLYDQGLDKEIQDQHSSTLNRLNSIQKGRSGLGPPYMSQPKSAPNLADQYRRAQAAGSSPHALAPIISDAGEVEPPELSPSFQAHDLDESNFPNNFLDPKDRGKATAMGVFNKPTQYSEQEFLQRQKVLNSGRTAPNTPRDVLRPPKAAEAVATGSDQPVFPDYTRSRSPTDASQDMPRESYDHDYPPTSSAVDASPVLLPSPGASDTDDRPSTSGLALGTSKVMKRADIGNTHLMAAPPQNDHPAFRATSPFDLTERADRADGYFNPNSRPASSRQTLTVPDMDSPARHAGGPGLSNMVRQHLRHGSGVSSIFEFPSQPTTVHPPLPTNSYTTYSETALSSSQDSDARPDSNVGYAVSSPWDSTSQNFENKTYPNSPIGDDDSLRAEESWQQQLKKSHTRGVSTETAAERRAFSSELEKRQKAIQEKLKHNLENETRSPSPTPSKSGTLKAMNILRSKTSRDSIMDREQQTRQKKMMALGYSTSTSTTGRKSEDDRPRTGKYGVPIPPEPEHASSWEERRRNRDSSKSRDGSQTPKSRSPPASARSSMRNRSDSEASAPGGRSRSRTGRYRDDLDKAMAEGTSSRSNSIYPDSYSSQDILEQNPMPPPPMPQLHTSLSTSRLRSNSKSSSPGVSNSPYDQTNAPAGMRTVPSSSSLSARAQALGALPTSSASSANLVVGPPGAQNSGFFPAYSPAGRSPVDKFSGNPTPPVSGASTPLYTSPPANSAPFGQPSTAVSLRSTAPRKRSVQKNEISEPQLIAKTTFVDTVDLPPGASLKNGMDEAPIVPPIPAVNPRRRMFTFGRSGEHSSTAHNGQQSQPVSPSRSGSRDPSPKDTASVFEHDDDEEDGSGKMSRNRSRTKLVKKVSNGSGLGERLRRDRGAEQPIAVGPPATNEGVWF